VVPEIHVSFYEPRTLERLLTANGFRAEFRGFLPGFEDIYKFKALKNAGFRKRRWWQGLLPWGPVSRWLDRGRQLTAHPVGWAA
jgi:hypothetical protein